jgi:hypothetical protein
LDLGPRRWRLEPVASPEHRRSNRRAGARNGAAAANQDRGGTGNYVRIFSRVWEWPIPPGVYVDLKVVRACLSEEAMRGREVARLLGPRRLK